MLCLDYFYLQCVPNKTLQKEIESLEIKCTHHADGCSWTGRLRDHVVCHVTFYSTLPRVQRVPSWTLSLQLLWEIKTCRLELCLETSTDKSTLELRLPIRRPVTLQWLAWKTTAVLTFDLDCGWSSVMLCNPLTYYMYCACKMARFFQKYPSIAQPIYFKHISVNSWFLS